MSAWDNYDKWRLSTPWDNEPDYEVFETYEGKQKYFSCDENACENFDKEIKEMEASGDYEQSEIDEALDDIASDLGLSKDYQDAIRSEMENEQTEREYAAEYAADLKRDY